MDSENNASATSTRGSAIKCDDNGQWDGNWGGRKGSLDAHMVEEAMQKHKTAFEEMTINLINSGLDEQSAEEKAYSNVRHMFQ